MIRDHHLWYCLGGREHFTRNGVTEQRRELVIELGMGLGMGLGITLARACFLMWHDYDNGSNTTRNIHNCLMTNGIDHIGVLSVLAATFQLSASSLAIY